MLRVSQPATPQHSEYAASYLQRDVADEITTWQQSDAVTPEFAGESPQWDYSPAAPVPSGLGMGGNMVQRVVSGSGAMPNLPKVQQLLGLDPVIVGQMPLEQVQKVYQGKIAEALASGQLSPEDQDLLQQAADLLADGMVNDDELRQFDLSQSGGESDVPSVSAKRSEDGPPLEQALLEAGFFGAVPPPATQQIQRSPAPRNNSSLESELLSLMNLPPDTPIDNDGPSMTVGINEPAVQRTPDSSAIQRATDVGGDTSGDDNSGKDSAESGKSQDQQIEEMAEKVYRILQRRFRVEIERERGR